LLNVLSGRSSYESGVISINGERLTPLSRKKLMSKIAYVKQSDVFFDHLTVRDQLTYTALLRLPSTVSRDKKVEEVDKVISLLRLGKVADSQIKLCSGGEKKRVNIGTELLTDPQALLLDEPTSGLDSTSAVALIELLQKLSRSEKKTVITSIHQPSSAVFRSFDKLLMLAEGHVVYFGTPFLSLTYLSNLNLKTPEGYNAADHWMDLLVRDNLIEDDDNQANQACSGQLETSLASGILRRRKSAIVDRNKPRGLLIDSWDNEGLAEEQDLHTKETGVAAAPKDQFKLNAVQKYNTGWLTQYLILTHRSMKNSRSAIFTPLNLIKSAAIGVVVGLLFFQVGQTESSVHDVSSFFFFTMTYWVFDSMFNSLMAFPSERTVILKERASASYRLSAYFLAKTTSEAPTRLLLPLVYISISFWMSGVNNKFTVFLGTTGCTLLSVLSGEAIGLFIGASMYNIQKALAVMTVFALALMLLGGFFVDNIPSFIAWAKYLSPFKYAFDASQQLVFDQNVPCDGSGQLQTICGGSDEGYATPQQILSFLQVEGSIGFNVGMLFVISTVPRYLAYLTLRSKKSGDRE
jgi:ABC-type multidrug transport system ATPase subunit